MMHLWVRSAIWLKTSLCLPILLLVPRVDPRIILLCPPLVALVALASSVPRRTWTCTTRKLTRQRWCARWPSARTWGRQVDLPVLKRGFVNVEALCCMVYPHTRKCIEGVVVLDTCNQTTVEGCPNRYTPYLFFCVATNFAHEYLGGILM